MTVFDFPTPGLTSQELYAQKMQVRNYIRDATDPNESGANGRSLLLLSLIGCFEGDGESVVSDLLNRGADPNLPSPWNTFVTLLSVSNSLPLVKQFVDRGLRINDVYEIDKENGGLTRGPTTLLDHLYGVRAYIAPKRKKINALADKYAGGLGSRRKFIDEAIAFLESRGAKRAADLQS
jgi:hypothetical protein